MFTTTQAPATLTGTPPRDAETDTVIGVQDLVVSYGASNAVDGISFDVRRGEVFALLGTNGAGKTTTLDVLEGFRRPTSGQVRVLGVDPERSHDAISPRIGIMLQEAGFFEDLSVRATLKAFRRFHRHARSVDDSLELVGLTHRANARVRQLSGGERRRLDLALALLGHPELLFLDEPTTGIDPEGRRHTLDIVRSMVREGMTVVLTTHYLDEAQELADHLAIMHRGRIQVAGTVDEVLSRQPDSKVSFTLDAATLADPSVHHLLAQRQADLIPRGALTQVRVDTPNAQTDLFTVLQAAARDGSTVRDLQVHRPSLEEVFLSLAEQQDPTSAQEK